MTSRTGKPIVIADYDPGWPSRFRRERALILTACGEDSFVRVEHVGSTAVPGLGAKPIIDIMPGVRSLADAPPLIAPLASIGYEYVPEYERPNPIDEGMPDRRYFRKDVDGQRAFHMHLVEAGGDFWRNHLMFRNHLRVSPEDIREYERIKRRLAEEYNRHVTPESNINIGYTDRKSDCINAIMAKARARIVASEPVVIEPYDPDWARRFERERQAIIRLAGETAESVEHVGSTSVPGLAAKPIVDLALGVRMEQAASTEAVLASLGYKMDAPRFEDWRLFGKANEYGTYHLHLVPFGGERWRNYLYFREWLRGHPEGAAAYATLKRELAAEFGKDRLGYVEAKSEFVERILWPERE